MARTLFQKIYDAHLVATRVDGRDILYVDRTMAHDLHAPTAFAKLAQAGRVVRRPDLTLSVLDHSLSARRGPGQSGETAYTLATREGSEAAGVRVLDLGDAEQGISHVVAPETGMALPGSTYCCPDSHACTVGGLGTLAFHTGTTELEHAFATQTLAIQRPRSARLSVTGTLGDGVSAKDVILRIIAEVGTDYGRGHVVEYAGPLIRALPVEGRLTLCNMSIELGARTGIIAPDAMTTAWLAGRTYVPAGADWEACLAAWEDLYSDDDAEFDKERTLDLGALAPQVSWGTDPSQIVDIGGRVPDPATLAEGRASAEKALAYMDLAPGTPLEGIPVNRIYIGSCTNARLPDLEEAAKVLKGRRIASGLEAWVVPGSSRVKREAEAKGLDRVFRDAGFFWGESGCSMCAGAMLDKGQPGERCVSTTNRNFEGRQGKGVRTHLVSPAMAAAAAVTGKITDVRRLGMAS